jgi:hypothetical protein
MITHFSQKEMHTFLSIIIVVMFIEYLIKPINI